MRRNIQRPFLMLLFTTALLFVSKQAAAETPNVIVSMADDLGYGDVSCYGATSLKTPNIDKLANEGLRFTSGYCSASTCTPTRYSLLTGTYAFRGKRTGIAPPNAPAIIKPETETVASILKRAGYATAVIGKWHLGLGGEGGPDWNGELKPGPLEIGFDTCFLLPTTNDRVPQVYVQDHRVPNLDPADPLWVGRRKPSPDHPTGLTHRDTLNCYGITLSANVVAHNGGGIDLKDTHGCSVSANTFTIMKSDALRIGPHSARIAVGGNSFSSSYIGDGKDKRRPDDQQVAGMVLSGTSDNAISGNVFSGARPKAVQVEGQAKRVLFNSNVLVDTQSDHKQLERSSVQGNLEE